MTAPLFTSQERYVLRQLWSIVATLDHRRHHAIALEQQLAGCPYDTQRCFLLKDLFEARKAENGAILDLRDGVYHACSLVGAAPAFDDDEH